MTRLYLNSVSTLNIDITKQANQLGKIQQFRQNMKSDCTSATAMGYELLWNQVKH